MAGACGRPYQKRRIKKKKKTQDRTRRTTRTHCLRVVFILSAPATDGTDDRRDFYKLYIYIIISCRIPAPLPLPLPQSCVLTIMYNNNMPYYYSSGYVCIRMRFPYTEPETTRWRQQQLRNVRNWKCICSQESSAVGTSVNVTVASFVKHRGKISYNRSALQCLVVFRIKIIW